MWQRGRQGGVAIGRSICKTNCWFLPVQNRSIKQNYYCSGSLQISAADTTQIASGFPAAQMEREKSISPQAIMDFIASLLIALLACSPR